ncbi:MAG TPA: SH3 domain-containing protein [Stellaceae bacterium]|nr:SH3 domain-containing protein [Stellaceae bacterium]
MAQPKIATLVIGALCASVLLTIAAPAPAAAADEDVGLKVPRWVSLHSDKVNLRTGPGRQYPIEWVLTKRDMPVEIVAQFEHWRHVREWDGTEGWVQEHMVTAKRYVVIDKGGVRALHREPDASSGLVARAEPGVVAQLSECRGPWCRVAAGDVSGWLRRTDLWGVYPDESVP